MLELNKVYQMDCLELLGNLDDESVDLFLLDPPYMLGKKPFVNKAKKYKRVVEDWDNQWKTKEDYADWCEAWLDVSWHKLNPGGSILIFGTFHSIPHIWNRLDHMGTYHEGEYIAPIWTFKNFITWFLPNAMPVFHAKRMGTYAYSCQYILYFSKGSINYFGYDYLKNEVNNGKQHRDLIIMNNRPHSESLGHPTQKPEALMEMLVQAHCPPDGLIVDYFCGSGTSALAAFRHGRNFIVGDMNKEYVEMTKNRLVNEQIDR